ncbi:ATP-binding protein [Marivirga harenae]|uniref:ATP-binding protein n=1 Tax=Marivirga harenae TaxID=2010992 RepID=UPI0026E0592E|nr:ATP-binding protein [Marivirga harenae]WKV10454.1 ATP-binding protein [Marivirga harenae]|tara:strand:- start:389736 stop:390242 length:507 start_codon:yes stop_codon:yes gene_type:complete
MKKIAIIGPESTGKSTLSKALATHYNEPFVPEYGRKYLEENGKDYNRSDLLAISKGMVIWEERMSFIAKNLLFCDTDLIMMKVWYEVNYGECHPWVLNHLQSRPYNFYLLCAPDLPWEEDPLRENPNMRDKLFERYHNELVESNLDYTVISGTKDRLERAIEAVEKIR